MAKKKLTVFDVVLMYPDKGEFIRTTVQAKTNVRAFMRALANSKWKAVDIDDVLYHTTAIADYEVGKD